ncbi:Aminotransferase class-III [Roseomonas rosea]|uniref:Aminotransferase class-III n=1 Tax=Muricoccus roseus TaxID=198092 RepID=A0A1M6HGS9_9PROT|nr:aminotransferase class III-fold pyridoxal phosphate-dependent enzyme [Roseomonas rosea]SHJ21426.1 Aminotransferase class-III [Roseomonas rosea]
MALHGLRDARGVTEIRNLGLLDAIEFGPEAGGGPARAQAIAAHCFKVGVLIRATGDSLVLSPPLGISAEQIGQIMDAVRQGAAKA